MRTILNRSKLLLVLALTLLLAFNVKAKKSENVVPEAAVLKYKADIFLDLNAELSKASAFYIIDKNKSIIANGVIKPGIKTLKLSAFPEGTYLIKIKTEEGMIEKRFSI